LNVRVLVVDDHPTFRRALVSALAQVGDVLVAGEAGGGIEACHEADALDPDIVLMDVHMPDLSGIEAMKQIHERTPDLPVVFLTAHADSGVERAAREAGASGFLPKGSSLEDIVDVLQEAAAERVALADPSGPGATPPDLVGRPRLHGPETTAQLEQELLGELGVPVEQGVEVPGGHRDRAKVGGGLDRGRPRAAIE
jgi:DNA-binding NarL/FixJ family response regulator